MVGSCAVGRVCGTRHLNVIGMLSSVQAGVCVECECELLQSVWGVGLCG